MAHSHFDTIQKLLGDFFPADSTACLNERTQRLLAWCEQKQIHILFPAEYPPLLREIPSSPPWLFVQGNRGLLSQPALLAFVGTRRPSAYGLRAAHFFSRELVGSGFVLVSGLARGIDSVAHSMSVLHRHPTVAVLGHGLDRLYPTQNRLLAREILEHGGCLVSEYPPGIAALPHHFPARNRILSGMCVGVVVVEAGAKSGSLITARHALNQNREVYVVPGPYYESGFAGSHWLLQQGAKLVTTVEAVIEELRPGVLPLGFPLTESQGTDRLREIFKTRSVASLEDLANTFGHEWGKLQPAFEQAMAQGWVIELGPQRYVYAGK